MFDSSRVFLQVLQQAMRSWRGSAAYPGQASGLGLQVEVSSQCYSLMTMLVRSSCPLAEKVQTGPEGGDLLTPPSNVVCKAELVILVLIVLYPNPARLHSRFCRISYSVKTLVVMEYNQYRPSTAGRRDPE
jgi:hypothetical protein